ncbi:EamA family transporter [[Haemophilus] felis]|nr:EamA family transporter [[Haemophilus] felis]NBI42276.1 EamA family transporter [[Haemophilus] felis]
MGLGTIWGLLSGLFWAIAGILYENLHINYPFTSSLTVILFILFLSEFGSCAIVGLTYRTLNKSPLFSVQSYKKVTLGLFAGLIGGPIGMLCYLQSIQYIGIGLSAPISTMYPIVGTILSVVFLNEKINKKMIFGLALVMLASFLLGFSSEYSKNYIIGISLAVMCAFSWGSEIVISSYIMRKTPPSLAYLYRQLGSVLGYSLLLILLSTETTKVIDILTDIRFDIFVFSITIFSMFSYILYYKSIHILKPIKAMILNITYGCWVLIINLLFLGKNVSLYNAILASLVFIGAYITLVNKKEEE